MVDQYLGARLPAPANGPSPKEAFAIRMVWLREKLQHIPADADEHTLRQYARCYILLFIGGYLMHDNAVLAWTYRSLCNAAERRTTDIARCVPLILSMDISPVSRACHTHPPCRCMAVGKEVDRIPTAGPGSGRMAYDSSQSSYSFAIAFCFAI
ncbi:hypothetical protein PIB30_049691 [Stylosanthes scabra]|uniref:Uncharacterized protein n=1 Tax=Stylosanthes scabra TaxID=79078 RepID=A0ABU6YI06_9FABA|nr:hypothetical protein [Stylosanthes scabra]